MWDVKHTDSIGIRQVAHTKAAFKRSFPLPSALFVIHRNSSLVQAALKKGKSKKAARNFAYKTLLADNIPQSINI